MIMPRRAQISAKVQLEGSIAATLENLVEALRLPADYPARQEYINVLLAKADVLIADRNGGFVRRAA